MSKPRPANVSQSDKYYSFLHGASCDVPTALRREECASVDY